MPSPIRPRSGQPVIPSQPTAAKPKAAPKAPTTKARAAAPTKSAGLTEGPVRIPFQLTVDGKQVPATLVGNIVNNHQVGPGLGKGFDKLRVISGGRAFTLTDAAMNKLLADHGMQWDAENSCQTQVLHQSLLSVFTGPPDAVTYDGAQFRMVQKSDFNGAPLYFHDQDVSLVAGS